MKVVVRVRKACYHFFVKKGGDKMKWCFQAILEVIATIIAYLTNWLVVFFADECGQLPKCLKWWQTYDNPLDVEWMITEGKVPKFARYDFKRHYDYYYEDKGDNYMKPGYVILKDPDFTLWERFQRYVCRLYWIYRNSNYGFSYYVNGRVVDAEKQVILEDVNTENTRIFKSIVNDGDWWSRTWCYYYEAPYCKYFKIRVYLGWKLKSVYRGTVRHQIALFFNPFRSND